MEELVEPVVLSGRYRASYRPFSPILGFNSTQIPIGTDGLTYVRFAVRLPFRIGCES